VAILCALSVRLRKIYTGSPQSYSPLANEGDYFDQATTTAEVSTARDTTAEISTAAEVTTTSQV